MNGGKGFTLIEVLVALVVTSLLLLGVYGVFSSVSGARQRVAADGATYHQARVIFDRIGRELRGAYQTERNARTRFAGGLDRQGRPFLELSTTSATPQGGPGGIVLVRYELRNAAEAPGLLELVRMERPLFSDDFRPGQELRLAGGLLYLRLRFFSDGIWRTSWDATEGLPQLVELTLGEPSRLGPVTFASAFDLGGAGGGQ